MKAYTEMLRDIVRDQGDPENFRANAVRLDDSQLAIAMKEYDDAIVEVAGDIAESVQDILRFKQRNGFVQMLGTQNYYEAVGLALVAGCRNRLTPVVRRDLELKARDMAEEDRIDAEVERV